MVSDYQCSKQTRGLPGWVKVKGKKKIIRMERTGRETGWTSGSLHTPFRPKTAV